MATEEELDGSESWDVVLHRLEQRRTAARAMGGEDRLRKHRDAGKLDARARIDHLLDRVRRATCCRSLERALYRRQAPPEPVARIGIVP